MPPNVKPLTREDAELTNHALDELIASYAVAAQTRHTLRLTP